MLVDDSSWYLVVVDYHGPFDQGFVKYVFWICLSNDTISQWIQHEASWKEKAEKIDATSHLLTKSF